MLLFLVGDSYFLTSHLTQLKNEASHFSASGQEAGWLKDYIVKFFSCFRLLLALRFARNHVFLIQELFSKVEVWKICGLASVSKAPEWKLPLV